MDQDLHTMHFSGQQPASSLAPSALHSQAFPAQQQLPNQTANGGRQFDVPEDVESALRYTPLTSAVPATGGILPHFRRDDANLQFLTSYLLLNSHRFIIPT